MSVGAHASYMFSETLASTLHLKTGPVTSCELKVQTRRGKNTLGGECKIGTAESRAQAKIKSKLVSKVYLKSSLGLFSNAANSGVRATAGLTFHLSPYTKLSYCLQAEHTELSLQLKLARGGVSFAFPLQLTHTFAQSGLFLGLTLLGFASLVTHRLVQRTAPPAEDKRNKRASELEEAKRLSQEFIVMITAQANFIAEAETSADGLVILGAFYGSREAIEANSEQWECLGSDERVAEVTVPTQFLVENSRLYLAGTSKALLNGFYNPLHGQREEPVLFIRYSAGRTTHSRFFEDCSIVALP